MEAQFVGESDGLTFWLARPKDYDEVMAISRDIYQGNDYLPYRYHTWMTEADRVVILGRRNGKLVALDSALVVDGGQTVVLEGLRVCPSERGHGVAGVIQRVTDCYIKQVYPGVTTKRLTRGDNPGPEKLSKFTLLACRAVLSLCGEGECFKRFVSDQKAKMGSTEKSEGPNYIQNLFILKDSHQLKALFLDSDLSKRLQLPGGAIIQDWQPLKPVESNLEILERRNLTWMVDGFNDKPMFMSLHTPPYPVPFNRDSVLLNIDMFGTDVSIARKALIAHLEQAVGDISGTVVVHVYMPKSFWEAMRQFCDGEKGVNQCMVYAEQLLLETKML